MLYLIATPIGNLQDISLRAISTLRTCTYVLCEDTRTSKVLLTAHKIDTPLKSFHSFNEKAREDAIIQDLKSGQTIGLISDAGTPGICDPGEALVRRCYIENIPVTTIPGPCAWAAALSLSPFPKEAVQFLGFLPKKEGERQKFLARHLLYSGTTIFYEAPSRLIATLKTLPPGRDVCVVRELTKIHEEIRVGTAQELHDHYTASPPKGEIVLLVAPPIASSPLSPQEYVYDLMKTFHISQQEAIKIVADLLQTPKREIYRVVHNL